MWKKSVVSLWLILGSFHLLWGAESGLYQKYIATLKLQTQVSSEDLNGIQNSTFLTLINEVRSEQNTSPPNVLRSFGRGCTLQEIHFSTMQVLCIFLSLYGTYHSLDTVCTNYSQGLSLLAGLWLPTMEIWAGNFGGWHFDHQRNAAMVAFEQKCAVIKGKIFAAYLIDRLQIDSTILQYAEHNIRDTSRESAKKK